MHLENLSKDERALWDFLTRFYDDGQRMSHKLEDAATAMKKMSYDHCLHASPAIGLHYKGSLSPPRNR